MPVGLIKLGLMRHGIAMKIAKCGFSLIIMENPRIQPVADLIDIWVRQQRSVADIAKNSDLPILCVTGFPQVEAVIAAKHKILSLQKTGTIIVNCCTALPEANERIAKLVMADGINFLNAPMTRLTKQACKGTLNILVGGEVIIIYPEPLDHNTFTENIGGLSAFGFGL